MQGAPRPPDPAGGSPYQGYAYSYPHKTAYRPIEPPSRSATLWAEEPRDALFLYVHIPFCEMRCGFCNLFTQARPEGDAGAGYLDALRRQAAGARGDAGRRVARFAMGGGTPTYWMSPDSRPARRRRADHGGRPAAIPGSVEASPETRRRPRSSAVLRERGVDRISIGVESFDEAEARGRRRPQQAAVVERALDDPPTAASRR